jgi:5-methylcytosine-specific restriction endonuclease McrA
VVYFCGVANVKAWAEQFYNSAAWHDCREAYMQSAGYICERCGTAGDPVAADIVHHRIYIDRGNVHDPNVTLSFDNLEALCQTCHNREHRPITGTKPRYAFDSGGNMLPPLSKDGNVRERIPRVRLNFTPRRHA